MSKLIDKYLPVYYINMFKLGELSFIGTYKMTNYLTPEFFDKLAAISGVSLFVPVISEEIYNLHYETHPNKAGIYISTRRVARFKLRFEYEFCPYILKRRRRKDCIVFTPEIIKEVENQYEFNKKV